MAMPRFYVAALLLAFVVGCAGVGGVQSSEQVVSERALLRWQRLVAGDVLGAYQLLSPSYRSAVSESQYRSGLKLGLWKGAVVKSVVCRESDVCLVDVEVSYQIVAKLGGSVFSGKEVLHETWRRDKGEWWNVPNAQ